MSRREGRGDARPRSDTTGLKTVAGWQQNQECRRALGAVKGRETGSSQEPPTPGRGPVLPSEICCSLEASNPWQGMGLCCVQRHPEVACTTATGSWYRGTTGPAAPLMRMSFRAAVEVEKMHLQGSIPSRNLQRVRDNLTWVSKCLPTK